MTNKEMSEHILALLKFFREREIDEPEAVAIMGNMICHMIMSQEARESFLRTCQRTWDMVGKVERHH